MSPATHLKKNAQFLNFLLKASPRQRCEIIKLSNSDQVKAITDCVRNVMKGNVPVTREQKHKLKSYKRILRKLMNKKVGINKRKHILVNQKGGFFSALLAPILTVAGSLLGDLLQR